MMEIYEDLDNYLEVHNNEQLLSENKELKIKLEENSVTLNKLKQGILQDFDRLSSEHQLLLKNFSALLKTAKAEIERKTQTIMQINIEKDELFLRLANSRFNGKKPMSQKNNIVERIVPNNANTPMSPGSDVYPNDVNDVTKKEITGIRNKKYETRLQKKKIEKGNLKEVQNSSSKTVPTNEAKESCRDKENQVKCPERPVENIGSLIEARTQILSKIASEEEGEIANDSIDLRHKIKKSRWGESQESTYPFAHTKEEPRETRSNKHSRNKAYEIKERDMYNPRDKLKRFDRKGSADRQYRGRAPERDFSNEKFYQRGRSRHRVESPSERYYRDKSRGYRHEYKQDRFEDHKHDRFEDHKQDRFEDYKHDRLEEYKHDRFEDHKHDRLEEYKHDRFEDHKHDRLEEHKNEVEARMWSERVKHKASDGDSSEPSKKRRRHSMYEGPEEGRSRRQSEHLDTMDTAEKPYSSVVRSEGAKGSILGERLDRFSCQSPDDPFAERNMPKQPLKLISHTATTKLDDPRQNSRRYIQIQDRDNKPCLVVARSANVQLRKVPPWIVVDSKPADEDKVREIYADIDKQIHSMCMEADKSIERKERRPETKEKRPEVNERVEEIIVNDKVKEIMVDEKLKDLVCLPNIESSVSKEEEVKQAIKNLSDSPVPIKKYIVPKRIPSNEYEKTKDNLKTIDSNTFEKQIPNESVTQVLHEKNVAKHKNNQQDAEQTDTKSKEVNISSTKIQKSEIKKIAQEKESDIVHKKVEPETKAEPCNPLQILFNHLKLAQANIETQEPNISHKDETSIEASVGSKLLNHAEANIGTNAAIPVHKSIVEGDLELSDETNDFQPFNDKYSQKSETPKKKKTKKANKDVNETKPESETKIDKKALEIKAKFSDLFGETSCSLITPEDLNIPRPVDNYPCMPSMDSTNEAWSLQNSPWKPDIENPEQKTDKVIEEDQDKESDAIKQIPNETLSVKINEKAKEERLHSENYVESVESVSTPIALKPKAILPNGFENPNIDFQSNYKTPIKALATSTPLRPNDKIANQFKRAASSLSMIPEGSLSEIQESSLSKIQESSLSGIPESSLSGIPENTSDLLKDLSVSDSSKSHTATEIDVPDVRIVIKRKKRVLKK